MDGPIPKLLVSVSRTLIFKYARPLHHPQSSSQLPIASPGPNRILEKVIIVTIFRYFYRLFLHPLRSYPGPRLAAISHLPYISWCVRGILHSKIRTLHEQYGEVVRIRPNSLTYCAPQAWEEIYGHRKKGQRTFTKDPQFYIASSGQFTSMINANEEDHIRQKRLLTHAFSEKALRDQESLIMAYIDVFITRLAEYAASESPRATNIVHWLNYLTFDIVGDLSFGEPFGCLDRSTYHPWVETIFKSIKTGAFLRALAIYPLANIAFNKLKPKRLIRKRLEHYQLSRDRVHKRLHVSNTISRPDFLKYILKNNSFQEGAGMAVAEIELNAALLIQAGSETVATALSACCFYLGRNPPKLEATVREVRTTFADSGHISFSATSALLYLNAVIKEALRLYPPAPGIGPRLVPEGGAVINDQFVPAGVSVSVAQFSTFRSPASFIEPDSFLPERWLPNSDSRYLTDNKNALQPFSYGPRACIGKNLAYAEMRTILSKILWHFDISLQPGSDSWDQSLSYIVWENQPLNVVLRPAMN
ncbi:hypothetical protein ASPNIDRAFT_176389, partial [Aspergillus niger ATCC 1015]